ncbi:MAG: preprotein translocase subunit SecG [Treponemataceae bacterium]|nr:preprotein translocase subunit SecG [Treponemataceae bacterium]
MGVIGIILLVAFVIISILLVCIILIQNEDGEGFGGLFGGTSSQAFGARSGNVLTRTTYILVTLFFLTSFGLALVNRTSSVDSLDSAVQQNAEISGSSWVDAAEEAETAPAAE